jgi:hypothetical protein
VRFSRAILIGTATAGVLAFAGCQVSPTSTAWQGDAPARLNGLGYGSGQVTDTTTAAVSGETTAAPDSTGGGLRSGLGYGSGH